jgi:competence protein ComGC
VQKDISEIETKSSPKSWGKFILVIVVIVLVVLVLWFMSIPNLLSSRRSAWMSRAKGTLRSTGSTQLAYQGTNNAKNFGSFQALKDTLYVAEGYSLGNMIENYSMTWAVYKYPDFYDEDSPSESIHTFTIVAYPRDLRPRYLLTFGITEDQIVRMYNPENSANGLNEFNGLDDPRVQTWDPVEEYQP